MKPVSYAGCPTREEKAMSNEQNQDWEGHAGNFQNLRNMNI
jgi:hypothetical protein